ncbi:glycosyltransferase family 4 protein [Dyadobacter sp. CY323]|uniref:glycosyltransferase family 4 protein n=1 Tax=Dyadobacter sp. CY323 TaxID=2907302 RepID=UPI001F21FDA1|nr:glycosyltransferase family 4 protein [Dyadobacter sp. CY323]MCE6990967.1 glycosyltransferase family 4 protein [Dyadobacter sp. CY323]
MDKPELITATPVSGKKSTSSFSNPADILNHGNSKLGYKRVLLLAHDGEDFYKARIPFARYLQKEGCTVSVLLPADKYTELIQEEGFEVQHSNLERDNTNLVNLISTILFVQSYTKKNNIDLIHSFKFIPNLINVLSNIFTKKKVVLHIAGLGIAFANKSFRYRLIKIAFRVLFFFQFLRADLIIIQNPDDFDDFLFKEHFRHKIKVVKGSGVNIETFHPRNKVGSENDKSVFLCTTRLIWEKGIAEMAQAFDSLPETIKSNIELLIIGDPDIKNPRAVSEEFIDRYKNSKVIRFLGRKSDVEKYLDSSDVFILPSYYREGIPRSILEALACGLPIITTTVPGCNLTVKSGENGFLIEPRSIDAIRQSVEEIVSQKANWKAMGESSRQLAVDEFSEEVVFSQIVKLYSE